MCVCVWGGGKGEDYVLSASRSTSGFTARSIKKRLSAPREEGGGREKETDGETEGSEKNGLSEAEKMAVPMSKRRKLSRTPLSVVQATPTPDTPTITSSEVEKPEVATSSQLQSNQTKQDEEPQPVATAKPTDDGVTDLQKTETESGGHPPETTADSDERKREEQSEERGEAGQRKLSISEMKAQM